MFSWKRDGKAAPASRGKGFLTRLARDARGNTLAIVGAALVPLAAMIGSGVDMSRAYMAKSRLQNACDAAALAGRRVMQADTPIADVETEAERFFYFNFPQRVIPAAGGAPAHTEGPYGTNAVNPVVTSPTAGTVRVEASTRIPTTIMGMFGFEDLPLNVTCDASLNFVNTDIMLVLDVTGSMAWNADGSDTTNVPLADQRITSLRLAVMALYDELSPIQEQLEEAGLRLRYGIVPYSSTVNVGHLITDVNQNYITASTTYWSRRVNFTTPTPATVNGPYWEYYRTGSPGYTSNASQSTSITQAHCLNFMRNQSFSRSTPTPAYSYTAMTSAQLNTGGPAPNPTVATTFPHDGVATQGGSSGEHGWSGSPVAPDTSGTERSCRRRRTETTTYFTFQFNTDAFGAYAYDTSQFRLGNPVNVAVDIAPNSSNDDNYGGTTLASLANQNLIQIAAQSATIAKVPTTWNGCIEERDTIASIDEDTTSIPSGAHDLDINGIPSSDATRWRPQWQEVVWNRSSGTAGSAYGAASCPRESVRLTTWTEEDLQDYVDDLTPVGSTYHDIGMIWGARMISTGGIFADGCETFNSMPCNRHIIFMTDGEMAPTDSTYSAYGINRMAGRIGGAGEDAEELTVRHNARFLLACTAAKSMGVSVWVIAFGVGLTDELTGCASNENQASAATDQETLIARFRQIGNQIGALRLTQ